MLKYLDFTARPYLFLRLYFIISFIYIVIYLLDYYLIECILINQTTTSDMIVYHCTNNLNVNNPNDSSPNVSNDGVVVNEEINNIETNVIVDNVNIRNMNISPRTATAMVNTAFNGTLMGVGMKAGMELAKTQPTLAGKAASLVGGTILGATSILAKDGTALISNKIFSKKEELMSTLDMKNLLGTNTGNDYTDLLAVLQVMHKLELFFIQLILFYIGIGYFNESLRKYVVYLPIKLQAWANK